MSSTLYMCHTEEQHVCMSLYRVVLLICAYMLNYVRLCFPQPVHSGYVSDWFGSFAAVKWTQQIIFMSSSLLRRRRTNFLKYFCDFTVLFYIFIIFYQCIVCCVFPAQWNELFTFYCAPVTLCVFLPLLPHEHFWVQIAYVHILTFYTQGITAFWVCYIVQVWTLNKWLNPDYSDSILKVIPLQHWYATTKSRLLIIQWCSFCNSWKLHCFTHYNFTLLTISCWTYNWRYRWGSGFPYLLLQLSEPLQCKETTNGEQTTAGGSKRSVDHYVTKEARLPTHGIQV